MTAQQIRELIRRKATGTRRRRFPAPVQAQIAKFAEQRRRAGVQWKQIAEETGVSAKQLSAWCQARHRQPETPWKPVQVLPLESESNSQLRVVAPNGLRIEGLTLSEAARLMQLLG